MSALRGLCGNPENVDRQAAKIQAAGEGKGGVMAVVARTRDYYHALRSKYRPDKVRLVIVAESPPVSGLYFYDSDGRATEPLFKALMEQLQAYPCTKREGLLKFQQSGWILVDATYKPVNIPDVLHRKRNDAILADYSLLEADLESLIIDRSTPLILIKANICRVVGPKLLQDGFNVLNRTPVYFPSNGRQSEFRTQFGEVRRLAGI
jgi:hypothetical protein